jgi:tRNA pseudouridine38-40 synthase
VGWQRQDNGPSVQQTLEEAIRRFSGIEVRVHGAGRTDAGVHALAQVAHFDLDRDTTAEAVRGALNAHVRPWPVAVLSVETVTEAFHARFSATGRRYLYRILNRRAPLTLDHGRAWQVARPLDAGVMDTAARVLLGRHDFSTFRASLCQAASPIKTLDRLRVERHGDELRVTAAARSFLHHQVRNIVGTLVLVGTGKWSAATLQAALEARDRGRGGPTAPPDGLYFTGACYPTLTGAAGSMTLPNDTRDGQDENGQ